MQFSPSSPLSKLWVDAWGPFFPASSVLAISHPSSPSPALFLHANAALPSDPSSSFLPLTLPLDLTAAESVVTLTVTSHAPPLSAHVHGGQLSDSCGALCVSFGAAAGAFVRVRYFVSRPYAGAAPRPESPPAGVVRERFVHLGHRGAGANSARVPPRVSENTLLSFYRAHMLGKKGVEFDVQLTRERDVVIWHDFVVPIEGVGGASYDVAVNTLTAGQFHAAGHPLVAPRRRSLDGERPESPERKGGEKQRKEEGKKEAKGEERAKPVKDVPPPGHVKMAYLHAQLRDSLPLLSDLFTHLPVDLSFDIEVKYPCEEQERGLSMRSFERNLYVDTILSVVFSFAAQQRGIFFSSFDPEVCELLGHKQRVYPVFFLTRGREGMGDARMTSLHSAIQFAAQAGLGGIAGVVSKVDAVLKWEKGVEELHKRGMVLGTYGEKNNKIECVERQLKIGVDIIISDSTNAPYLEKFRGMLHDLGMN